MKAKVNSIRECYVYVHRKATNNEVFYVGKGSGQRAWSKQRNKYWNNTVGKYGYIVEIVHKGLQEWYAHELECELIVFYGRQNLCNLTDGGEGFLNPSDEARKNMVAKMLGTKRSEETKAKMSNSVKMSYIKNPHLLVARSKAQKGKKKSQAHIEKMRNNASIPIVCSNGMVFDSAKKATEWLKQTKYPKASAANIGKVCLGKQETSYGLKWWFA